MNKRKTKLINIEWLFVDNSYDLIINDVFSAAQEKCNTVIFLALMDGFMGWNPKQWVPFIEKIDSVCKQLGIDEIIFISGAGATYEYGLTHKHYFYDWNMSVVKNGYKLHYDKIKNYNIDSSKFMFLTGRPARPNRIGLMSRLYDLNILDNGIWSFFPPWNKTDNDWCIKYLSKYNTEEYDKFLQTCNRSLDSNNEYNSCKQFLGVYEGNNWHSITDEPYIQNPSFIDLDYYDDVKISIISEGPVYWEWSSDRYYLTDKTYREILMKKPIIISGYVEQYKQLKNLGFRMYEDYLSNKNYGTISDEEQRLDAIADNVDYFLKTSESNFDIIKEDVDFNSKLLYSYFRKQDEFLVYLQTEYNVIQEDIDFYFNRTGLEHLIQQPQHS